ncbi:MAG: hypothetical protein ACTIA6_12080 [Pseudoclavibacter sp.]
MDDLLLQRAGSFADEMTTLVNGVLHGEMQFQGLALGDHVQIGVLDEEANVAKVPLYIQGQHVANWSYTLLMQLDGTGQHLKVRRSNFALAAVVDRTPLVRYEFDSRMINAPVAHWQMHAERGAFSHLLGQALHAGKKVKPHSLDSIHFPVGGGRMRAGLEDLLEFLVRECHFDARGGWKGAVRESRERYRVIQARTLARDAQAEVADVLRSLGWTVEPPVGEMPLRNVDELQRW